MSGVPVFDIRLTRLVHPGLRVEVALSLDREVGVLFGPSGAGKTTVLRLIAGLERPESGWVRLGDAVLFDSRQRIRLPMRVRRIGLIYQDDRLFPHLNVEGNLRFGLKGRPRSEIAARLAEVANLCGVSALLGRRVETLSGGERQRVGLARALAPRPRLLLCDEPVSALDLEGRHALLDRLRAIQAAEAIPVLYVTHSPAEAIALGTRLFLMSAGRIVAEGPPLDVLASRNWPSPHLAGIRNTFPAQVLGHNSPEGSTRLRLIDGPDLLVPFEDRPVGSTLSVGIPADDILLAREPISGLSARNLLPGEVLRIVPHGPEAEVLVRTGGLTWMISVVTAAVSSLELAPGSSVCLIIKARSCRILAGHAAPAP